MTKAAQAKRIEGTQREAPPPSPSPRIEPGPLFPALMLGLQLFQAFTATTRPPRRRSRRKSLPH